MSAPPPVPDPALAALAARRSELARGWLLALVAARPLEQAPRLPVGRLAAQAPALVGAILDAVGSERRLAELAPGAERGALAREAGALADARGAGAGVAAVELLRGVLWNALAAELRDADAAHAGRLADRLAHVCAVVAAAAADAGRPAALAEPALERPLAARRGEGWRTAIERHARAGAAFALLLVELLELARLQADELERAAASLEPTLAGQLGPQALLAREAPGRWWVLVPAGDAAAAHALAERLAAAAASAGAPVVVGGAASPRDGVEADALIEHADTAAFAARAAGVSVAPAG